MQDLTHFKEDLRRRLPISQVISKDISLQSQGKGTYKGLCPFHKEKTPSFHVYDDKANYHCFGCGAHGDIISYIEQRENLTFIEALEHLGAIVGLVLPKLQGGDVQDKSKQHYDELLAIHEEATCFFEGQLMGHEGQKAREYMQARKISDTFLATFRLGYAPKNHKLIEHLTKKKFSRESLLASGLILQDEAKGLFSRFRGRLMFPIMDRLGKVIAFGGRLLEAGDPKYLNSPETLLFHKGRELYHYHQARKKDRHEPLLVCEGYMDVMALEHMQGIRSVATLGTALTEDHMALVWRLSDRPILCFDGDVAGQRAAEKALIRLLPLLKTGMTCHFLTLSDGQDPADYWEKDEVSVFQALVKKPMTLFEYIWKLKVLEQPLGGPEDQARIEHGVLSLIDTIQDMPLQAHGRRWAKQELSNYFWEKRRGVKDLGSSKKKHNPLQGALLPRLDADSLRAKIVLAYVLNYPQLVQEYDDIFLSLEFKSDVFMALKEAILAFSLAKNELENCALRHHLKEYGYEAALLDIQNESIYLHSPLARPGHAYEKVKESWISLVERFFWQSQKKEDVTFYRHYLHGAITPESWGKVKKLREEIQAHDAKLLTKKS